MKILASLILTSLFFVGASAAFAMPDKMAENNPQVVAYYPDGTHGIVGENDTHTGWDLVKQNGNSGTFQQWFYGSSTEDGMHGDHSLWKPVKEGEVPPNSDLVYNNPNNFWGDYLQNNTLYSVMTNDFKPSN